MQHSPASCGESNEECGKLYLEILRIMELAKTSIYVVEVSDSPNYQNREKHQFAPIALPALTRINRRGYLDNSLKRSQNSAEFMLRHSGRCKVPPYAAFGKHYAPSMECYISALLPPNMVWPGSNSASHRYLLKANGVTWFQVSIGTFRSCDTTYNFHIIIGDTQTVYLSIVTQASTSFRFQKDTSAFINNCFTSGLNQTNRLFLAPT